MRYLTISLVAMMTIFFVGCAKQNVSYIALAQTIHPIVVPAGAKVKTSKNYYPVPNNVHSIKRSYSLVPPGSNLQRFDNQSQLQSLKTIKTTFATLQQNGVLSIY